MKLVERGKGDQNKLFFVWKRREERIETDIIFGKSKSMFQIHIQKQFVVSYEEEMVNKKLTRRVHLDLILESK